MEAMKCLDQAEKMPLFVVPNDKLRRIPSAKPSETATVCICERLNLMEARLESHEKLIAKNSSRLTASMPPPRLPVKGYAAAAAAATAVAAPKTPLMQFSSSPTAHADGHSDQHHNASRSQGISGWHPNTDSDGFQVVSPRRRRRPPKCITGTAKPNEKNKFTGGPEPSRDFFVFRVNPSTGKEDIINHLGDANIEIRKLEKTSPEDRTLRSYHLQVKASA